jgi:hypothetical protein
MSNTNTGGPAFPLQSIGPDFAPGYSGMTLRDYFAAKAMQGMLADPDTARTVRKAGRKMDEAVAELAYMFADAMLKARDA